MNVYRKKWYNSRREYLMALAEEFELDYDSVFTIAGVMGPEEDFDGLLTALEDLAMMGEM